MKRLPRPISIAAAFVVLAGSAAVVAPTTSDAATAQCAYTPKPPATLSVGQSVVGMTVPLAITGTDCTSNYSASVHLVHSANSFFLDWSDSSPTDNVTVYDFDVTPGTYTTAAPDCFAASGDYETEYTCAVTPAKTVIKFTGHTGFTATRHGKTVALYVKTSRYYPGEGFAPIGDTITFQSLVKGVWHTIGRATTTASKGYTWNHTAPTKASYRVIMSEYSNAFAATSATRTA
jgi:hypothetical protein